MQTPDKARAIAEVLAQAVQRHGTPTPAALDDVASRAYDAGYLDALRFALAEITSQEDRGDAYHGVRARIEELERLRGR